MYPCFVSRVFCLHFVPLHHLILPSFGLFPKCYTVRTLTTSPPSHTCTWKHRRLRSACEATCVLFVFFWLFQTLNLGNCFENRLLESNPVISLAKALIHLQDYCCIVALVLHLQKYASFLSVIIYAIWFLEVKSGLDRSMPERSGCLRMRGTGGYLSFVTNGWPDDVLCHFAENKYLRRDSVIELGWVTSHPLSWNERSWIWQSPQDKFTKRTIKGCHQQNTNEWQAGKIDIRLLCCCVVILRAYILY